MATPNPLEKTHGSSHPSSISKQTYHIAGILTTVYGLDELSRDTQEVACLWLLHPRLQTQECMAPVAARTIIQWNNRIRDGRAGPSPKGLIAVGFDQRNHGSRQVDKVANEAWRGGNPRHAQDMFSIYHGTAVDTSHLLSYLPAYLPLHLTVTTHLALGISLGGHSVWHCLLSDPRITTGVVVIGCPDYTRLMQHRAEKSRLHSWTSSSPPGSRFIGSADFPPALVESVGQFDPAGLLLPLPNPNHTQDGDRDTALKQTLLRERLGGKRLLNMSGGADKLVPYSCGVTFLDYLKNEISRTGCCELEDIVFDGAGHEMTAAMAEKAVAFVCDSLNEEGGSNTSAKTCKI
ncbi:hypothetical protein W97_02451 [Coniosporium apollinis CBS 100218]|uniref:AB hydrolase-1 domain-containing protein n=1 Tax=Coniosporium apollinis (strain CBS 100218) TaxID=1168221 RepID=R7YN40_CONA1|nr:uncharacterized protein W97_02451 [Coniosporium apollinis CBS 100218]EON63224.1 hypothetical protein W97_02451 [Coniosporium apollinis CBS 100218]